jgi:hypothetical protein
MSRIDRFVRRLSWGFVLIALCTCASAQMTLEIIPASPRYEEPVYARIVPGRGSGFYVFGAKLSMSGTGITIEPDYIIEIGGGGAFDVLLGRFPSGEFTVQLMLPSGGPSMHDSRSARGRHSSLRSAGPKARYPRWTTPECGGTSASRVGG